MGTRYTVSDGDCMNSIAFRFGFFPETLWLHADNSELRSRRKADNVLMRGDVVNIPALEPRSESGATEQRHTFRRRGVPAVLRMVFTRRVAPEDDDANVPKHTGSTYEDAEPTKQEPKYEPLANAPYLVHGDFEVKGKADGDGRVELKVPPDAVNATIVFYSGTKDEVRFELALGHVDPVDTPAGASQRLSNLSYSCTPDAQEIDEVLREALRRFQADNGLKVTGDLDKPTQDKLVQVHGS